MEKLHVAVILWPKLRVSF